MSCNYLNKFLGTRPLLFSNYKKRVTEGNQRKKFKS